MHEGRELVLPIWHGTSQEEILKHSPPLADAYAVSSADSIDSVVQQLLRRLRPEESPLIVAREFLMRRGVTPPIVTDEWWLDVVEFKEGELRDPDLNVGHRWIFPLPFGPYERGKERGVNIAWTALQLDWMHEGMEQKYCQLTRPDRLHEYLRKWPGLLECCRTNASVLAVYAPQLTIRGFDDGLSDVFDDLLKLSYRDSLHFFSYDSPDTVDGSTPLCGEGVAWRHDAFGNYTDGELASSFTNAHTLHYSRTVHDAFACLVWLLTDEANWLPTAHRDRLTNGLRTATYWWFHASRLVGRNTGFRDAVWKGRKRTFRFTNEVRADLAGLITAALSELGISENVATISQRFIGSGFVEGYYDEQEKIQERRSRTQKPARTRAKRSK